MIERAQTKTMFVSPNPGRLVGPPHAASGRHVPSLPPSHPEDAQERLWAKPARSTTAALNL
jgi:hypothetical protein